MPLGLVFACYMLAKMCGTYAFEYLISITRPETALTVVLSICAIAFAWPVWRRSYSETLIAHCVFEFSVGMYVVAPCYIAGASYNDISDYFPSCEGTGRQ